MTSRFTVSIHMLGLLAWWEAEGCGPATSERMAQSINTNPVVVRRLLGALRTAGLVETRRGAGGGVRLTRPAADISLRDVYEALEAEEALFALHSSPPNACCTIGGHIEDCLVGIYGEAEAALKQTLEQVTIRTVYERVVARARQNERVDNPAAA